MFNSAVHIKIHIHSFLHLSSTLATSIIVLSALAMCYSVVAYESSSITCLVEQFDNKRHQYATCFLDGPQHTADIRILYCHASAISYVYRATPRLSLFVRHRAAPTYVYRVRACSMHIGIDSGFNIHAAQLSVYCSEYVLATFMRSQLSVHHLPASIYTLQNFIAMMFPN